MTPTLTRRWFVAIPRIVVASRLVAAERPATRPATTRAAAEPPVRLVAKQWEEDVVRADADGVLVTSSTGIGTATLARTGASWGKTLAVRLRYTGDRPFRKPEGSTVVLSEGEKEPTHEPGVKRLDVPARWDE